MLAVYLLLVLVGYAVGRLHTDAVYWMRAHRKLPPATPRAIALAARRNRADLRLVMRPLDMRPAREIGVHVRARDEAYAVRADPPRLERLSEPPAFLPDVRAFDEEHTR
jgi:hypothetical protein